MAEVSLTAQMRERLVEVMAHLGTLGVVHARWNDELIARALGWELDVAGCWHAVGEILSDGTVRRTAYSVSLPWFTASVDAAATLLPGRCTWCVEAAPEGAWATIGTSATKHVGATPALALCRAALAYCLAALNVTEGFRGGH